MEQKPRGAVLVEEAVRTAEIEGQKLNIDSVRSSVAVKLGLPAGVGVFDRNVDGLVDVLLDAVRRHDKPMTVSRLNGWHASLFPSGYSGLRKIRTGKFRGAEPMRVVSGPIGKEKIHFEALPAGELDKEMRLFLEWLQTSRSSMDGILRAAAAHLRFLTIHPYEDGNGRLARALTDMALSQDESIKVRYYSLSSEIMRERKDYYKVLEEVQSCRVEPTAWYLWFLRQLTVSIKNSEKIIASVYMKAEFWNKNREVVLNARQKKVVSKMLEAGPGGFEGGLTTRKYVGMTKTSRATAFREISDLLDKKMLFQLSGKGRSVHYELELKQRTEI